MKQETKFERMPCDHRLTLNGRDDRKSNEWSTAKATVVGRYFFFSMLLLLLLLSMCLSPAQITTVGASAVLFLYYIEFVPFVLPLIVDGFEFQCLSLKKSQKVRNLVYFLFQFKCLCNVCL